MFRIRFTCAALLVCAGLAGAKEHNDSQRGTVVRMDAAACGMQEKDSKGGEHKKSQELLCKEYVLQGERVIYRIRSKDEKHSVLLPIGQPAEFRIHKDKLVMRMPEFDDKEREFVVVSMSPREAESGSSASASKN